MKKVLMTGMAALMIAGISTITQAKPVNEMDLDITGLAQFNYSWSQQTGANDQLDTQRLRLQFSAQPSEYVSVYAAIEGTDNVSPAAAGYTAAMVDTTGNGIADTTIGNNNAADGRLVDLYADVSYYEWATLRLGQFTLPNSYEINTPEYELETINYTMGVGTFGIRDRGLMLMGETDQQFGWAIWGVNGNGGITGAGNDTDDQTDFGLQFDYSPVASLGLKAWGSWSQESLTSPDVDAYGFGFDYVGMGFHLFGEYNLANTTTSTTTDQDLTEWYLNASYKIPETDLQVVARYDWMEAESGAVSYDTHVTTAGFNWDFDKNARLQLMHEFVDGSDRDNTDLQLSVRF